MVATCAISPLLTAHAADVLFSSAGRFVVRDQGLVSILFKLVLKFVDLNFFWCGTVTPIMHLTLHSELVARFAHLSGDYTKFRQQLAKNK